ncbi:MAG TPA: polysaccharide deacetylase family protein [Pyrinomonadaceae bacterium]|jgi:chitin deacetylase
MHKLIVSAVVLVLLSALAVGLWKLSNSRTFQAFGTITPRVETDEKIVALTFDDGPTPQLTDEILGVLSEQNTKATFFLVGGDLEKNLEEGRKIVAAGHEVGNHSYSHTRMVFVTPSFVKAEIERTDALLRAAGYEKPLHFRPPYGKKLFALPLYLSRNDRRTVTWDVEPETFSENADSPESIVRRVLDNAKNGSIILLHVMHDPQKKSLRAVKPIIEGLKGKGFRFATVSELIASER